MESRRQFDCCREKIAALLRRSYMTPIPLVYADYCQRIGFAGGSDHEVERVSRTATGDSNFLSLTYEMRVSFSKGTHFWVGLYLYFVYERRLHLSIGEEAYMEIILECSTAIPGNLCSICLAFHVATIKLLIDRFLFWRSRCVPVHVCAVRLMYQPLVNDRMYCCGQIWAWCIHIWRIANFLAYILINMYVADSFIKYFDLFISKSICS